MTEPIRLVFNAQARRGRAWEVASILRAAVAQSAGAEWAPTEYPGHATLLAEQAAAEGFRVVAALGGDGTAHEVANGLMRVPAERRPEMAIVPIGSGNDFSLSVGIPPEPEAAMRRVFEGAARPVDLGRVTDAAGRTTYFCNALGIGFDANVTFHSYRITYLKGFSMYLWAVVQTILRNHNAPRLQLEIDGQTHEQEALMLVLCNGPREGGGFRVAPAARSDDGVLDYAMIARVSRPMMFRLLPEVMNGTHGRFPQVRLGTFHLLTLSADRPLPIHADGEVYAGFDSDVTWLRAEIEPGALRVRA